jgi:stage III sporulation protein AH
MLNEMINNNNLDSEKKNEVTTAMLQLQQRIEKETAAEAMIESKGFKEVYVRIDDDTVDVVVDKAQLTESEIAQIQDIVKRKTGMPIDKIRISPLKKSE